MLRRQNLRLKGADMKRLLPLILVAGCRANDFPGASPLDQYEVWDRYESFKMDDPKKIDMIKSMGQAKLFTLAEKDVTEWWIVLVEPQHYETLKLNVYTDAGIFESDYILFADIRAQSNVYPLPITVDTESFERYPFGDGWRVVAFAHFPEAPKGQILRWEVTP